MRVALVFLLMFSASVRASCVPSAFVEVAGEYSLPEDIFYAISLVESGRYVEGVGFRVWPWALNIDNRSFYPASEIEARKLISNALDSGTDKIAVGVMQVYWKYHKDVFAEHPAFALDVGANLRAGAKVLREFVDIGDGVWSAVGYYHAGTRNERDAKIYIASVKRVLDKHVKGACHATTIG